MDLKTKLCLILVQWGSRFRINKFLSNFLPKRALENLLELSLKKCQKCIKWQPLSHSPLVSACFKTFPVVFSGKILNYYDFLQCINPKIHNKAHSLLGLHCYKMQSLHVCHFRSVSMWCKWSYPSRNWTREASSGTSSILQSCTLPK